MIQTYSEPAPAKINVFEEREVSRDLKALLRVVGARQGGNFDCYGWNYDGSNIFDYGRIRVKPLGKEGKEVFYLNESHFAAEGGKEHCFFARNKGDLEEFCKDFRLDVRNIQEWGTVSVSLP